MSENTLLLGNEAIALGAIHAGLGAAYAYPGTPSTELMEYLVERARESTEGGAGFKASWSANEKTAYEEALGAALVGRRSLVAMKHVGLNVAADPFMNSALLGLHAGLVLVVADDPGMHSSQNEQDSRFYADFAKIPCFEPMDHQECYDQAREAFELSERFGVPVMLRLVTRLAHSRGSFRLAAPARRDSAFRKPPKASSWILMPANAKRQWHEHLEKQKALQDYSERSPFNRYRAAGEGAGLAVITSGLATAHFEELEAEHKGSVSHLKIATYPLPEERIRELAAKHAVLYVLEEGYPLIERQLRGIIPGKTEIRGKLSGHLPLEGELTPDLVRAALGFRTLPSLQDRLQEPAIPGRPPQLCNGCPHADSYGFIKTALQPYGGVGSERVLVTADIGCYTLGALPPYSAVESCVCMGASIGMAKGAADSGFHPAVAVIGDSTFLHSGVSPLLDAIASGTRLTVVILDNETTAMTGGQPKLHETSRIRQLVLGLGADPAHVHEVQAHRKFAAENVALLARELEYPGVSVIIAVRECVETAVRGKAQVRATSAPAVGSGT
ncbi:MAG: thiamine pyrophosphate-dependent enzyme [Oligoflexia bacterium]|nr:thiamine pyrophosphate-dependent enzyme [Oligoflexia bacterium]